MNNPRQHRSRVPGIRGHVAGAALALAIMLVLVLFTTGSAQAQTYTFSVLYSFTGPPDGDVPYAGVLLDAQGNLYGTTAGGGDPAYCAPYGCGTVFKLDPAGNETVLYNFTGTAGDGLDSQGNLVRDASGNLYGTTLQGGASGNGIVFKLDSAGKETVLYTFTGGADGGNPYAGLVRDTQGNLYGTTSGGGNPACKFGCGTVFKLDTAGNETVLYTFTDGADGAYPEAGLVRDTLGNLYGTTSAGGDPACKNGCGIVFKLDASGNETVLHGFTGSPDGAYPYAGLVRDTQGNLYGTTLQGGASGNGIVFKLDSAGKETVLHDFAGSPDGAYPYAGLVRDTQGNLYGTTSGGGASVWWGTVFKVDTTGKETVLYSFTGAGDGMYPNGLVRDAQGNLYGTAANGGVSGDGTVFKLTPPTATTTTITSSLNPSIYGQAITFTAAVTSSGGTPPDGETVSFMKGTTVLGTGALSGGSASFTTSTLKVGTNAIKAVYPGDSNFASSTSKTVRQVVSKATTTTALASSLNPSKVGQSVTFTASVAPQFSGTPTGKVAFYDGPTLLKTVALSGGAAKFTTKTLTKGLHSITATYDGSTSFDGSSSAPLTQTVD